MKRNFIFLVVCAYLGLTGCTDKTSHYVLKCHARQDVANVDDDAFMQIASKAIYDELQSKNKLSFCLLYTSPSPRDRTRSRMPSSA